VEPEADRLADRARRPAGAGAGIRAADRARAGVVARCGVEAGAARAGAAARRWAAAAAARRLGEGASGGGSALARWDPVATATGPSPGPAAAPRPGTVDPASRQVPRAAIRAANRRAGRRRPSVRFTGQPPGGSGRSSPRPALGCSGSCSDRATPARRSSGPD